MDFEARVSKALIKLTWASMPFLLYGLFWHKRHEKKLGFDTRVFLISNGYLSPVRHLQSFVDTENIMVDCLRRDPEGPCPLLFSYTGTERENISLQNSAQKTNNPIKGTFPAPLPFYCTIIHHIHNFSNFLNNLFYLLWEATQRYRNGVVLCLRLLFPIFLD